MANALTGNAPQQILQAISGVNATEQVILNRAIGAPTDNYYTPQEVVNLGAGRTKYALTYQQALKANTGFTGVGSVQDILMYAYNNSLSMATIIG